jgi:hypothetical protein
MPTGQVRPDGRHVPLLAGSVDVPMADADERWPSADPQALRVQTRQALSPQPAAGRQRRSSKALLTTLTLDSAIAAPATTGLSRPKAASGIPTTL